MNDQQYLRRTYLYFFGFLCVFVLLTSWTKSNTCLILKTLVFKKAQPCWQSLINVLQKSILASNLHKQWSTISILKAVSVPATQSLQWSQILWQESVALFSRWRYNLLQDKKKLSLMLLNETYQAISMMHHCIKSRLSTSRFYVMFWWKPWSIKYHTTWNYFQAVHHRWFYDYTLQRTWKTKFHYLSRSESRVMRSLKYLLKGRFLYFRHNVWRCVRQSEN